MIAMVVAAAAMLLPLSASAQGRITVSGTVTDASNKQALIGAAVSVEGTTIGTSTDLNGKYTLQVPANGVLEVQYLGYTSQKIKINSRTTINISLAQDNVKVEEVVVIGYGSVAKSDLTGSVSTVKMSEIADATYPTISRGITNDKNWLNSPLNVTKMHAAHTGNTRPAPIPAAIATMMRGSNPIFFFR